MARGFESKDVEFQQEEANRRPRPGPSLTPAERETRARQDTLALALAKARSDLAAATHPRHRQMLEHAIDALERQLDPKS